MKKIIICTYLLFVTICNAQINYTKHADILLQAYRAKELNKNQEALSLYEEAFALHHDNKINDYLSAANSAAQLDNEHACKKWLIEAIRTQKAKKKTILTFSKNKQYQKCASQIVSKYNIYISKYYETLENPMVYFEIQKLLQRDKFSRKINEYHRGVSETDIEIAFDGYLKAQAAKDSVKQKEYKKILFPEIPKEFKAYQLKLMRYTDSLNIVSLIGLTKEYGWQKEGWLLLWHQRGTYGKKNWIWDYFKPLINKEIEKGKVAPSFWVVFEDFKSIHENGKSIYGYHPGKVDALTVNIKRKSIGLPILTDLEIAARNNNPYGGRMY